MPLILLLDDNRDLAALLAGVVRERGYQVAVFHTGREAVAALGKLKVDAAVVDLLLPDLRGQEVLRGLAERGIPALAMSGVFRGSHFAEETTRVYGARAFFEKPFDLEALLQQLEAIVGPGAIRSEPPVAEPALEEAVDVDLPTETSASVRDQALRTLEVERASERRSAPNDLPFSGRQVWSGAEAAPRKAGSLGAGAGQLAGTSVPRLLTAAHQGRTSGELRLKRGAVVKVIWLAEGRPVYAASNVASERFGRYAVAQGVVKAEELSAVQDLATKEGVRTGEAMVRLALITPEQRVQLLHDQAQQILWSTFDWIEGEYQFVVRKVERPDLIPLRLALAPLILQGVAQLPLVRLREKVPSEGRLAPTADPVFELQELHLDADQARLLMAADGTKTREDLLALSDLEERPALALLQGLIELRILESRAPPSARKFLLI